MNLLSSIISAIFPPKCIVCDSILSNDRSSICSACNSAINWLTSDFFNSVLLRPHFDRGISLAAYDGAWANVIHGLKYNRRTDLAKPLAKMMAEKISYQYDMITFVPLHKKRLIKRGYNQSALLAKHVAKLSGIECAFEILKRVKEIQPQVGLEQKARLENVKGAFAYSDNVEGDILLIDDVMTTGATMNECAKVLKIAGAKRIDVLTLARTV